MTHEQPFDNRTLCERCKRGVEGEEFKTDDGELVCGSLLHRLNLYVYIISH